MKHDVAIERQRALARTLESIEPPAEVRRRVLERVLTTVALPLDAGSAPSSSSQIGGGTLLSGSVMKGTVLFVLGVATGSVAVWRYGHREPPRQEQAAEIAPAQQAAERPRPPPISLPLRESPPPSRRHKEQPTGSPSQGLVEDNLALERSLIEQARAALVRGNPEAAIAALEQHEYDFPSGELLEEREAIGIQALLSAGRRGQAQEKAEQFHERFPQSLFWPALERALSLEP